MTKTILEYLQTEYNKTKWPYFNLLTLTAMFGEDNARKALNELWEMDVIRKRQGVNHDIVELIIE
jgi:hypothetical protein